MPGAPSWNDLFMEGRVELLLRRPDLVALPGDITDMILAESTAMADSLAGYIADRIRAMTLGAKGDDLDAVIDERTFGLIQRNLASKATTSVRFTRATASAGSGTLDTGFLVGTVRDSSGKQSRYLLDAPVVFGATDLVKTGTVTAEKAGAAGNAGIGKITQVIGSPFDTSIQVTNLERAAGGSNDEEDEDLVERARQFPSTIEKGTIAALELAALKAAGVRVANAFEDETGLATLYVADAEGNSSSTLVAAATIEVEKVRAAGAIVSVIGGALLELEVSVRLTARVGFDIIARKPDIVAAITARGRRYGSGETARREHIQQAVLNVEPSLITRVEVELPSVDTQPGANEIIRFNPIGVE